MKPLSLITYLTLFGSFFVLSEASAAGTVKSSPEKRIIKANEPLLVSFRLLNQSKRTAPYSGNLSLFIYSDSGCNNQLNQLGQTISLSNEVKSGIYNVSTPGSFWIKPFVSGYTGDCQPITVLVNEVLFEKLSITKRNPINDNTTLQLIWENNSGVRATSSTSLANVSLFNDSSCSFRTKRTRILTISPTDGQASVSFIRPNQELVYVRASSGQINSSCIFLPKTNSAPEAIPQSVTLNEDESKGISLIGSDIDGDTLSYHIVTNPTNGSISGSGSFFTYTPGQNFNGTDSFSFKVSDGSLFSSVKTVSLSINPVNDPPVLSGDFNQVVPEDSINYQFPSFNSIAIDPDGNSLNWEIVSSPSNGTVSLTEDSSIIGYSPFSDFVGADSLVIRAFDGIAYSENFTINILTTQVNDPPVTINDSISSEVNDLDNSIFIPISQITENDLDIDSPRSSLYLVYASSSSGLLEVIGSTIKVSSIPSNQTSTIQIEYKISDGFMESNTSTVSVSLNYPCQSGAYKKNGICTQIPTIENSFLESKDSISAGGEHTCALSSVGGVKCWGFSFYGQMGDGSSGVNIFGSSKYTPGEAVGLNSGFISVSSGDLHTCAVSSLGGVKCWGSNQFWQLGDGTQVNRSTPVDVVGLSSGVISVNSGVYHTCALTSSGGVKCWGLNNSGQLGDGTVTNRSVPVNVIGLSSGVKAVSVGMYHSCALTNSGVVKCWGQNASGQLGDGTITTRVNPVDVVGLGSGVISLSVGELHTCAVTSAGAAKCWGRNLYGELGNGTHPVGSITPVGVIGLASGTISVSSGLSHNCALISSGGVKCWGLGTSGQIGDGSSITRITPVNVVGLSSGVYSVSVGSNHSCALTSSGGIKCWGKGTYGKLGGGNATSSANLVDVLGGLTYLNQPSGMAISGFCSGDFVSHSPESVTIQGKTASCLNGNYILKLDSDLLNDVFAGISSENRTIKVYDVFDGGTSPLSNPSVSWP